MEKTTINIFTSIILGFLTVSLAIPLEHISALQGLIPLKGSDEQADDSTTSGTTDSLLQSRHRRIQNPQSKSARFSPSKIIMQTATVFHRGTQSKNLRQLLVLTAHLYKLNNPYKRLNLLPVQTRRFREELGRYLSRS